MAIGIVTPERLASCCIEGPRRNHDERTPAGPLFVGVFRLQCPLALSWGTCAPLHFPTAHKLLDYWHFVSAYFTQCYLGRCFCCCCIHACSNLHFRELLHKPIDVDSALVVAGSKLKPRDVPQAPSS